MMIWRFVSIALPELTCLFLVQTCQRDILQAFSYSLGHNTPQPFIDELWLALPSLRGLLNFKDGWKIAQKQTWVRLLGAISG